MRYILVDPFNQPTSGVTTYSLTALLRLHRLGIDAEIVAKDPTESIEQFRRRLPTVLENTANTGVQNRIIEAPETLASTRYLPDARQLHIRLHGSRHFGAWLQGMRGDEDEQAHELQEIGRAAWVSAPSIAAVKSHVQHTGQKTESVVYPNPVPLLPQQGSDDLVRHTVDVDFLFLGRWQQLKGIQFFQDMAHRMPEFRFAIATTGPVSGLPRNIQLLPADTSAAKTDAIRRSAVVVIPSLFETASMVALEAMALNRPVVSWSHLGISEYARPPAIFSAEPWNIADLCRLAKIALGTDASSSVAHAVEIINFQYDESMKRFAIGQPVSSRMTDIGGTTSGFNQIIEGIPIMHAPANGKIFKRKFRKLLRDPSAYWRDSSFRKKWIRLTGQVRQASTETPVVMQSTPRLPESIPHIQPTPTSTVLVADSVEPSCETAPIAPLMRKVKSMGCIGASGHVKLSAPVKGPAGWRVCILHHLDATTDIDSLIEALGEFTDFSPVRADRLNTITFDIHKDETLPSIINRIDQKNKEILQQIDHLLMVNTPAALAQAIRYSSANTRTISVITTEETGALATDPGEMDALICLEDTPDLAQEGWRRKLEISSPEKLPLAIMRVLRETGPKSLDMLFQISGEPLYDPDLLEFDPRKYQGLIRLDGTDITPADTMRNYIQTLCGHIKSLYITESVYMKYRSFCTEIENGGDPAQLIENCLKDGVLFDVH